MTRKQFLQWKLLRVSAIPVFCIIGGFGLPLVAHADAPSVDASQNAKLNISVIQLKEARGNQIELEQQGIKNISIAIQTDTPPEGGRIKMNGDEIKENTTTHELKQDGVSNVGVSIQDTFLNSSAISQNASNKGAPTTWSENSLTVTDVGEGNLLLRYKSGEVDIMTVTSDGFSATSRFGRDH
jgi:hypothetical protein